MIHNNFWVFPDGTRRFIWFTVFSVSNRAQLSLQLVWNISSYVVLPFEIGAFILTSILSVEIILLRLADSTFSHSTFLYTKTSSKIKIYFYKEKK